MASSLTAVSMVREISLSRENVFNKLAVLPDKKTT